MIVGQTYRFDGNGVHDPFSFVVVSYLDEYRLSNGESSRYPGYRLLIVDGYFTHHDAGATLDVAWNSAIATDSKPLV